MPPTGLAQVQFGAVLPRAIGRQAGAAQGHDFGQIGVEPVVVFLTQPLEMLRQAATQVHAQAVGVCLKEGPPNGLDDPCAPQDVLHRGTVLQVGGGVGVHL